MFIRFNKDTVKINRSKIHLQNSEKNSVELNFKIKDHVTLVGEKAKSLHSLYKSIKIEHTRNNDEPWWGELADTFHVQGDIVQSLALKGTAMTASTIASAVGAVGLGAVGLLEINEGLKEKNQIKTAGGCSAILAGMASGTDSVINAVSSFSGAKNSVSESIIDSAGTLAKVFGVSHGTIDIILGGRQAYKGIKEKDNTNIIDGGLNIGIGSAMILSSFGIGGPVSAIALGTLFTAKLLYDHRNTLKY